MVDVCTWNGHVRLCSHTYTCPTIRGKVFHPWKVKKREDFHRNLSNFAVCGSGEAYLFRESNQRNFFLGGRCAKHTGETNLCINTRVYAYIDMCLIVCVSVNQLHTYTHTLTCLGTCMHTYTYTYAYICTLICKKYYTDTYILICFTLKSKYIAEITFELDLSTRKVHQFVVHLHVCAHLGTILYTSTYIRVCHIWRYLGTETKTNQNQVIFLGTNTRIQKEAHTFYNRCTSILAKPTRGR